MAEKFEIQFSSLADGGISTKNSLRANYADGGNRKGSVHVTVIV